MNGCARVEGFDPAAVEDPLNRWILGEAAAAVAEVAGGDRGIPLQRRRQRRLSLRLERAVRLVPGAGQARAARRGERGGEGRDASDHRPCARRRPTRMLHPFMPFLTEELWAIKGAEGVARAGVAGPLALAPWPTAPSPAGAPRRRRDRLGDRTHRGDPLDPLRNGDRAQRDAAAGAGGSERRGRALSAALAADAGAAGADRRRRRRRGAAARGRCRSSCATRRRRCRWPDSSTSPPSARGSTRRSPRSGRRSPRSTPSLANADLLARAPEEIIDENRERREAALSRIAKSGGGAREA